MTTGEILYHKINKTFIFNKLTNVPTSDFKFYIF